MLPKRNRFAPKPGEDLIDFCCSPDWAHWYAGRGMTPDYPPEYYQKPDTVAVEKIQELERRIAELEGKAVIKYIMPIIPEKQAAKPIFRGGAEL